MNDKKHTHDYWKAYAERLQREAVANWWAGLIAGASWTFFIMMAWINC